MSFEVDSMFSVDPFERLVTEAKDRLSNQEGRDISWRELSRRCGYEDTQWGAFRNAIRPQRTPRPDSQRGEGRRPRPDLIRRLARVLPVSEVELNRAAALVAGYDIAIDEPSGESVRTVVMSYLDAESLSAEERQQRVEEVLRIIRAAEPGDLPDSPRE